LLKRKFDDEVAEGWIACKACKKTFHQVSGKRSERESSEQEEEGAAAAEAGQIEGAGGGASEASKKKKKALLRQKWARSKAPEGARA
jgi:hypothetical protein